MTDKTIAAQPTQRFITIEPLGGPPRVTPLNAPDRRKSVRGPRTCEELGICQGRYPACGQCDDPHPEDDAPTLTPFEKMGYWLAVAALVSTTVLVAGGVAGFLCGLYSGAGTP